MWIDRSIDHKRLTTSGLKTRVIIQNIYKYDNKILILIWKQLNRIRRCFTYWQLKLLINDTQPITIIITIKQKKNILKIMLFHWINETIFNWNSSFFSVWTKKKTGSTFSQFDCIVYNNIGISTSTLKNKTFFINSHFQWDRIDLSLSVRVEN